MTEKHHRLNSLSKTLMTLIGMTEKEIISKLSLEKSSVSRLLSGKRRIEPDRLKILSEVLQCPEHLLVDPIPDPSRLSKALVSVLAILHDGRMSSPTCAQ